MTSAKYSLPNKHYIPVDMSYAGIDNMTPCVISLIVCLQFVSHFLSSRSSFRALSSRSNVWASLNTTALSPGLFPPSCSAHWVPPPHPASQSCVTHIKGGDGQFAIWSDLFPYPTRFLSSSFDVSHHWSPTASRLVNHVRKRFKFLPLFLDHSLKHARIHIMLGFFRGCGFTAYGAAIRGTTQDDIDLRCCGP